MSDVKRAVHYYKYIDDLNRAGVLPKRLYITNMESPLTEEQVKFHFALIDTHTSAIVENPKNAAHGFLVLSTFIWCRTLPALLRT